MKLPKFIEKIIVGGECVEQRGPLMTRYIVLKTPIGRLMVHCFHRSDWDRNLHDHPWNFITFLIGGAYIEHTTSGAFRRRRFSILYRPANWQHWVELEKPNTWTLVFAFKKIKEWGFITPSGWVHWRKMDYEKICED